MELNPYAEELRQADAGVAAAEAAVQRAQRDLDWFDSFEAEQAGDQVKQASGERLMDLRQKLTLAKQAAAKALEDLQEHEAGVSGDPEKVQWWKYALIGAGATAAIASGVGAIYGVAVLGEAAIAAAGFGVLGSGTGAAGGAWFAKAVNNTRSQKAAARQSVLQEAVRTSEERVADAECALTAAQDRYSTTNRADLVAELTSCTQACSQVLQAQAHTRTLFDAVHTKIAAHVERINAFDADVSACDEKLALARRFTDKLAGLPKESKRERYEVHEAVRECLGEGNLGEIATGLTRKRDALVRKRAKIEKEARDVVRVHQFGITRVVIDGNNMCHLPSQGGEFIGLRALKAACAALRAKGHIVRVLFDPSISEQEKLGSKATGEWLAAEIGLDVSVIVMPRGTRADEAVLREAAPKHFAAVSRDVMDEAGLSRAKYPALRDGRLFEHHITDEDRRVAIPALDIDVPWAD